MTKRARKRVVLKYSYGTPSGCLQQHLFELQCVLPRPDLETTVLLTEMALHLSECQHNAVTLERLAYGYVLDHDVDEAPVKAISAGLLAAVIGVYDRFLALMPAHRKYFIDLVSDLVLCAIHLREMEERADVVLQPNFEGLMAEVTKKVMASC